MFLIERPNILAEPSSLCKKTLANRFCHYRRLREKPDFYKETSA